MRTNKIFLPVASIIKVFIIFIFLTNSKSAADNNSKYYSDEMGTLSQKCIIDLTKISIHQQTLEWIFLKNKFKLLKVKITNFMIQIILKNDFTKVKKKKILITIDDAFSSFYDNAWPFLKKNKIPFILFVSTEPVGKKGYMTWQQIKEIEKEEFAFIGNHSHTHDYLTEFSFNNFKKDINKVN